MEIECSVEEIDLEDEETGREREGVEVTCGQCGHTTSSFGTSDRSIRRCLAMMREECPEDEDNYYVDKDE